MPWHIRSMAMATVMAVVSGVDGGMCCNYGTAGRIMASRGVIVDPDTLTEHFPCSVRSRARGHPNHVLPHVPGLRGARQNDYPNSASRRVPSSAHMFTSPPQCV